MVTSENRGLPKPLGENAKPRKRVDRKHKQQKKTSRRKKRTKPHKHDNSKQETLDLLFYNSNDVEEIINPVFA